MATEFTVRAFKDEDFGDVLELWMELELNNPERQDTLNTIHKTLEHNGAFFVLEQILTKKVVGTSWITNDGRRLYLHHFGIKPEFQEKKLSKLLLDASLNFAKTKNMQIKLEVHEQNTVALNLYQKAKFKYLDGYKVYIIR